MNQNSMIKKFDKSIVKYFMDFIETDFHKRSAPKKKVVYTNGEGLTIGCNLSKFNHISDKISNLLNKKIDSEIFIKKGEYCSNLSDSLKDKAKELFRCTCESNIDIIRSNFINDIEEYLKIDVPISSKNKFKEDIFKSIIPLIKDSIIKKYFTDNVEIYFTCQILSVILPIIYAIKQDILEINKNVVNECRK